MYSSAPTSLSTRRTGIGNRWREGSRTTFGLAAVGKRNDESVGCSKDVHRSSVELS